MGFADGGDRGGGGRDRQRVHGGGRGGDHEYHAGGGERAYARDRGAEIGGSAAAGYSESIFGGVVDAGGLRRIDWGGDRLGDRGGGAEFDAGSDGAAFDRGVSRGDAFGGGRSVFRDLSGAAGFAPGSNCGAAIGDFMKLLASVIGLALATLRENK